MKEDDVRERLADALRVTLKLSSGYVKIKTDSYEDIYSEHYSCKYCGFSMPKLEPRLFSFNSPLGACPSCNGLGANMSISPELLFDEEKSINKGGILPYRHQEKDNLNNAELKIVCNEYGIDMDTPISYLTDKQKKVLLYGSDRPIKFNMKSLSGRDHSKEEYFEGILNTFERRYKDTQSDWIREWIETFMIESKCKVCNGDRLNEAVLNILINGKTNPIAKMALYTLGSCNRLIAIYLADSPITIISTIFIVIYFIFGEELFQIITFKVKYRLYYCLTLFIAHCLQVSTFS